VNLHPGRFAALAILLLAATPAAAVRAQGVANAPPPPPPRDVRGCDPGELRPQPDPSEPRRVFVRDARVSLVPPEGMRALSPGEIEQKPRNSRGEMVMENSSGATIRLWFADARLSPGVIRHLGNAYNLAGTAMGGIQWIRRGEEVELGGTRWVVFDYVMKQGRGDVRYRMYMTDFGQGGLAVSFVGPAARREDAAMAASVATLEVHDCEVAPAGAASGG